MTERSPLGGGGVRLLGCGAGFDPGIREYGAISDVALKRPVPEELSKSIAALVGCIGGAIEIDQYRDWLIEAGFSGVEIIDSGADLNAYAQVEGQSGCCSPGMEPSGSLPVVQAACCGASASPDESVHAQLAGLLGRFNVNEYAASVKVFAVKPARYIIP